MKPGGRKGSAPDPADAELFAREMQGVRPLDRKTGRVLIDAAAPAPRSPPATPSVAAREEVAVVERWGERFALLAPGVDRRVLRELAAGERAPEAELDMHGLSAARATAALAAFIARARQEGRRCLLVIHGRGHRSGPHGPVLREALLEALLAAPLASALLVATTAPPALGGHGAALLLLRRR